MSFAISESVSTAQERSELIKNLLGGTVSMREAGETYIVRGSAEGVKDHSARVNGSILFGGYKRTVGYLTGQVFSKDVGISEDSPSKERFQAIEWNADLAGNNLRTFSQEVFEFGLNDGVSFVYVDHPVVRMRRNDNGVSEYYNDITESWELKNAEADAKNNWRPFFVRLSYDDILGGRYEIINGVKKLVLLRVKERVLALRGETEVDDEYVEQEKRIFPGRVEVWRETLEGATFLYDEFETKLQEIPLAVFMPGEQISDFTAQPALEDLAFLNLRHWQATADQVCLMSFVRRPPWFGRSLVQDGETIAFGPGRLVHSTSPDAALQSVGVDVGSVEAGRGELKDLEERMSIYGLMMLTPTRALGNKTATQASKEGAETTSQLKDWALGLKDCLDNALRFAAMYMDIPEGQEPVSEVNTEFNPVDGLEPATMIIAVEKGLLPKQIVYEELKERGLLIKPYDWEDVKAMYEDDLRGRGPTGVSGLASTLLNQRQQTTRNQNEA